MTVLFCGISISYVLYLWFQTDAFSEWCYFLGIRNLFAIEKFYNHNKALKQYHKNEYQTISYVDFLRLAYKDIFFIKIITCPVCVGFWLSLLVSLLYNLNIYFLSIGFISLLGYFLLVFICKTIKW